MTIKFNLVNVFIILLLVIFLPLVQNQWLNLYLFDKYNFTIYKLLYYASGLIFPSIVCFTSINKFTFYKFNNNKIIDSKYVTGKSLLIIILLTLLGLSTLISNYIFINFKIFYELFISRNNYSIDFEIDKYIFYVVITSIFLLFKKIKIFIKKIILINYFIVSILIWYLQLNNILFNYPYLNNFLKFDDINFFNIFFLLSIELVYYLWSYLSYSTYLSDWCIPNLKRVDITIFFNIICFYLVVFIYYFILSK